MNSTPGRLSGGRIRRVPADKIDAMLQRLKLEQGRNYRVKSMRYRITGLRDPESGGWISRDPANGNYYLVGGKPRAGTKRRATGQPARRRTQIRPTPDMIRQTDMLSFEVEIDRGKGPRIYYVSTPGLR